MDKQKRLDRMVNAIVGGYVFLLCVMLLAAVGGVTMQTFGLWDLVF